MCPGARTDLSEHDLTFGFAVPLHVRETAFELERADHVLTHADPVCEARIVDVAQRDHLRADPFVTAGDERAWPVPGDVVVGDAPIDGNRVEGVFLAVDKFLHAHHRHMPQARQRRAQLVGVVDAIGVRRARAGDGLEDQRESCLLSRFPAGGDRGRGEMSWRADASGVQGRLHRLLVAEAIRLRDGETGQGKGLADSGGSVYRAPRHSTRSGARPRSQLRWRR
jgi:hypothetical protein